MALNSVTEASAKNPLPVFPLGAPGIHPLQKIEIGVEVIEGKPSSGIRFGMVELNVVNGLMSVDPDLALFESRHGLFLVDDEIADDPGVLVGRRHDEFI